jgi:mono/diheme cytochrome c family protein
MSTHFAMVIFALVVVAGCSQRAPGGRQPVTPGQPPPVATVAQAGPAGAQAGQADAKAGQAEVRAGGGTSGADTAAGRRIFSGTCIACHQENGLGITGVYPSLSRSPVVLGDPVVLARWVVLGQRPATMPAGRYAAQMPQFGWLSSEDAASLFTYVRSSFGNDAAPVDAATVAKAVGD